MSSPHSIPLNFGRITAIANDHARMEPMFAKLRALELALRDGAVQPLELKSQVDRLLPVLTRHFASEESNAYFGVLMTERPSSCAVVTELCSEHAQMLAAIEELRARCDAQTLAPGPELADRVSSFCECFRAHEQKEAELMRAFLLDAE